MLKDALSLYAITDRHWALKKAELSGVLSSKNIIKILCEDVEKALKGGVTLLQLREKNISGEEFLEEAVEIQKICKKYNVPLIINDNVELAKKIDADGVHVGQSDMESSRVREILGPEKIIGVTAKSVEQAQTAEKNGADYLGSGAMFPTSTKDTTQMSFLTLKEICNSVKIPVVAIGGITNDNAASLKGSGIAGISVVSGIFGAEDIEMAAGNLFLKAESLGQ